jgi:antitoxin component YwqK of YwqJK toxin-antitoxin module
VIEESAYRDNKLDGEYTSFDEKTGKVLIRQIYENGRVVKVLEGAPVKK